MLKNYIKIAWRNLTGHKSYTFLNLSGLTVAMACCILILLYIKEELSFDSFHENADRIVAVGTEGVFSGRSLNTPYPLADALEADVPEVEQTVRMGGTYPLNLSADGQNFTVIGAGQYAESSFFEVFSFELIAGNKNSALSSPNSIVLSESDSRQIFGSENAVGLTVYWQRRDTLINLEVTGVIEDEPRNSSIGYNAIISLNTMAADQRNPEAWTMFRFQTYAVLQSPEALKTIPAKFDTLANNRFPMYEGSSHDYGLLTIPLTELYLSEMTNDEGFTGTRAYVFLFGSVALFILLIACVNYVNLSTARASLRSKEVGVRKTMGAKRIQVAAQFIGESVIISTAAYVLGWALAQGVLPFFNQLFGTELVWQSNVEFLLWMMVAAVGVGIAAGLYPSLYLSRFTPSSVLRNQKSSGRSGSFLRKSLVVTQFAIALVLIMGSMVVYQQLQYTQTKDLGFEGDQVLMVDLPNKEAWGQRETIRTKLASYSGIKSISFGAGAPGEFNIRMGNKPDRVAPENKVDTEETITFAPAIVDYDFLDLLKIDVIAGRNFSRGHGSDAGAAYIINEKGARMLGWSPEEAIGKTFNLGGEGKIVGVTENFHISSLHDDIDAVVLRLQESKLSFSNGLILAKVTPGEITQILDYLETEMEKIAPHTEFSYEFLDEKFDAMYRTERRFGTIVALFTVIAIMIACLGLYGLATFSAERRIKEIGIRKALGATVTNIVQLLSKDFLKLVALGFIIAVPIAWYAMNQWLADFAYRIEIGPGIFLLAGGVALLIAMVTVSWQSIRAALANPVDSLRSE